jgi:hypothetical protein
MTFAPATFLPLLMRGWMSFAVLAVGILLTPVAHADAVHVKQVVILLVNTAATQFFNQFLARRVTMEITPQETFVMLFVIRKHHLAQEHLPLLRPHHQVEVEEAGSSRVLFRSSSTHVWCSKGEHIHQLM